MSSIARIANKVFKNFQKLKASGPALIGPTRALKAAPSPRPFGPPFQQILDPPLFEYTGNRFFFKCRFEKHYNQRLSKWRINEKNVIVYFLS